jgi:hypothetical protein
MIRDCRKRVDDGCRLLGIFAAAKLRHIRELSHHTSFRNDALDILFAQHDPGLK